MSARDRAHARADARAQAKRDAFWGTKRTRRGRNNSARQGKRKNGIEVVGRALDTSGVEAGVPVPASAGSTLSEIDRRRPSTAVGTRGRKGKALLSTSRLLQEREASINRGRITGYAGHTTGLINATGVQTGPYLFARFEAEEAELAKRHALATPSSSSLSTIPVSDAIMASSLGPGAVSLSYAGHMPGSQFVNGL